MCPNSTPSIYVALLLNWFHPPQNYSLAIQTLARTPSTFLGLVDTVRQSSSVSPSDQWPLCLWFYEFLILFGLASRPVLFLSHFEFCQWSSQSTQMTSSHKPRKRRQSYMNFLTTWAITDLPRRCHSFTTWTITEPRRCHCVANTPTHSLF